MAPAHHIGMSSVSKSENRPEKSVAVMLTNTNTKLIAGLHIQAEAHSIVLSVRGTPAVFTLTSPKVFHTETLRNTLIYCQRNSVKCTVKKRQLWLPEFYRQKYNSSSSFYLYSTFTTATRLTKVLYRRARLYHIHRKQTRQKI